MVMITNTTCAIRREKSLSVCPRPRPPQKAMPASCPPQGWHSLSTSCGAFSSHLPGLPCSVRLTPVHKEEETAQQTLVCWPQSETWKFTKMYKQMFGLGGEKEHRLHRERRLFRRPWRRLLFTTGPPSFPCLFLHFILTSSFSLKHLAPIWG